MKVQVPEKKHVFGILLVLLCVLIVIQLASPFGSGGDSHKAAFVPDLTEALRRISWPSANNSGFPDVCPEVFNTSNCTSVYSGLQCFNGYIVVGRCNTSMPLNELVTLVFEIEPAGEHQVAGIQKLLKRRYNTTSDFGVAALSNIRRVNTKYSLVLPSTTVLFHTVDIERQIRMVQDGVADLVAGGHLDSGNSFGIGCYQTEYSPYTVTITEGYHRSHPASCVWCNLTTGLYIVKTELLHDKAGDRFRFQLEQGKLKMMVCPDSLYHNVSHMFTKSARDLRREFLQGSIDQELNRIKLRFHSYPRRETINYNCSEVNVACKKPEQDAYQREKGILLPLCCLKDGAEAVRQVTTLFQFVDIGVITNIQQNHKDVDVARKGQDVCIKIEGPPGDAPKMLGRHFEVTDVLVSKISRDTIDVCKAYFRDDLQKTDWQLIVELKKLFQII